jgi:hypothetical protein
MEKPFLLLIKLSKPGPVVKNKDKYKWRGDNR